MLLEHSSGKVHPCYNNAIVHTCSQVYYPPKILPSRMFRLLIQCHVRILNIAPMVEIWLTFEKKRVHMKIIDSYFGVCVE